MIGKLKCFLPIAAACLLLAGCTLPGEKAKNDEEEEQIYYITTTTDQQQAQEEVVNYRWAVKPNLTCDNIITPDRSLFDPDNIKSKAYLYASIICNEGKYGFVDLNANMIVYPEYDTYHILPSGEMMLSSTDEEGNVTVCTLDDYLRKQDQVSEVEGGKTYYWSEKDKKIYAKSSDGTVRENDHDRTVVVCKAEVSEIENGAYFVSNIDDSAYALADSEGLRTDFEFEDYYAPSFSDPSETLIALKKNDLWGYADDAGNIVLDFKFTAMASAYSNNEANSTEHIHPYLYSEGYVAVSNEKGGGYYTKDGSVLIPTGTFRQARPIQSGRAWVNVDGLWGVITLGEISDLKMPKITTTTTTTTTTEYKSWTPAATTTTPAATTTTQPTYVQTTTAAPVTTTTAEPVTTTTVSLTQKTTTETSPPEITTAQSESVSVSLDTQEPELHPIENVQE